MKLMVLISPVLAVVAALALYVLRQLGFALVVLGITTLLVQLLVQASIFK